MTTEDVDAILTDFASEAVIDPATAGQRLADWIGGPSAAGKAKLQQLAYAGPRLVAEAYLRGGAEPGQYEVTRDLVDEIPSPAHGTAIQAVVLHLNRRPLDADALIARFTDSTGLKGQWDVGVAALQLLTAELRDQRS
ncbi:MULTISPECIES: hypothetical protein [unclassified Amycolatopsis]|uniref:hypothetical protein n=1 Tax=unclassified Amycolatopsis TaxID=2618356 RepID=UPI002874FA15|nr:MULTISPECIES: hypothetical protein [unclassified Amycolatopsis]MDS0140605.1 hypothetical protein [Amycolatopsis sp. 505]MDS0149255.1 hypothetical protein [Amycolatopsis sp. CM201R]